MSYGGGSHLQTQEALDNFHVKDLLKLLPGQRNQEDLIKYSEAPMAPIRGFLIIKLYVESESSYQITFTPTRDYVAVKSQKISMCTGDNTTLYLGDNKQVAEQFIERFLKELDDKYEIKITPTIENHGEEWGIMKNKPSLGSYDLMSISAMDILKKEIT